MSELIFVCKELWRGESVTRSFLNFRLSKEILAGKTIDIGGGKNARYVNFMKKEPTVLFETLDMKIGANVDFEKDALPATDGTFDTVLFLNVMEHIFNYQHIANEVVRITKPGGQLLGFVPFLMWYHADHRDFFRYTHEALEIIYKNTNPTKVHIEPVAKGPFVAAVQMFLAWVPRVLRVPIFIIFYAVDCVFTKVKPEFVGRYALGYFFKIIK